MMGPRASSRSVLEQIFAGWPCIESYYDSGLGQHVVRLAISDLAIESVGFHGAGALVERLRPKTGIKPQKKTGVRFHGRVVGRRA